MRQNSSKVLKNSGRWIKVEQRKKDIKTQFKALNNYEMFQLTNNDQIFLQKIIFLNRKGIELINQDQTQEALIIFQQAQKLLQYAASCGKSIDRDIILTILNNKAFLFKKTWDLDQSIRYIEAITFNLKQFVYLKENVDLVHKLKIFISQMKNNTSINKKNIEEFIENFHQKIDSLISRKYLLGQYNLKLIHLLSENDNFKTALFHAYECLEMYRENLSIINDYLKLRKKISLKVEVIKTIELLEKTLSFSNESLILSSKQLVQYKDTLRKSFIKKNQQTLSYSQLMKKYSSQTQQKQYFNISLFQAVQIEPKQSIKSQNQSQFNNNYIEKNQIQFIDNFNLISQQILYYSITLFLTSRLIIQANKQETILVDQKYIDKQIQRKSQTYSLISFKVSLLTQKLTEFSKYLYRYNFQYHVQESPQNVAILQSKNLKNLSDKYNQYTIEPIQTISIDEPSIEEGKNQTINKKKNKLDNLLKGYIQNSNVQSHPVLSIEFSDIQSVQVFEEKSNNKSKNNTKRNVQINKQQINNENCDIKQTLRINDLKIKKLHSVQHLTQISVIQQKSNQQKKINRRRQKKQELIKNQSKSKSHYKQKVQSISKIIKGKSCHSSNYKSEYKLKSQSKIKKQQQFTNKKANQIKYSKLINQQNNLLNKVKSKSKRIQFNSPKKNKNQMQKKSKLLAKLLQKDDKKDQCRIKKAKSFGNFENIKKQLKQQKNLFDKNIAKQHQQILSKLKFKKTKNQRQQKKSQKIKSMKSLDNIQFNDRKTTRLKYEKNKIKQLNEKNDILRLKQTKSLQVQLKIKQKRKSFMSPLKSNSKKVQTKNPQKRANTSRIFENDKINIHLL